MRKTLLLAFLLLACAAWVMAQQGDNSPTASSQSSIEGCLGGSAGNFTVMDKAGTTYQLQLPQGADNAKLSQHIGEEVRVTGTVANGAGADASSNVPPAPGRAAGTAAVGQSTINVSKMDKIGDACSNSQTAPSK
jgi:hypothetical protein